MSQHARTQAKVLLKEWRFSEPIPVLLMFGFLMPALIWTIALSRTQDPIAFTISLPGWISAFGIVFLGFGAPLAGLTSGTKIQVSEAGIYLWRSEFLTPFVEWRVPFEDINDCSPAGESEGFLGLGRRPQVRISVAGGRSIILEPKHPKDFVSLLRSRLEANLTQKEALAFPPKPMDVAVLFMAAWGIIVPFVTYYYVDAIGRWPFLIEVLLSLPVFLFIIFGGLRRLDPDERFIAFTGLVWALGLFVSGFSGLYFNESLADPASFTPPNSLAKTDALYLCLGTLTTGSAIEPASAGTRMLAACQMVLTLFLVTIAVTVVLPRLLERDR